eukprot:363761-Chlamydomonas_euryale.AAC.22
MGREAQDRRPRAGIEKHIAPKSPSAFSPKRCQACVRGHGRACTHVRTCGDAARRARDVKRAAGCAAEQSRSLRSAASGSGHRRATACPAEGANSIAVRYAVRRRAQRRGPRDAPDRCGHALRVVQAQCDGHSGVLDDEV